ncbi:hypothetical protein XfCFBP8082_11090 [Xylella fastidiosa subsp. fastidiosa]|nr:hypothetical protein F7G16_12250 [Xylella fastidiosa]RWA34646.1 hypothetical protein XfCFBP7970_09960 [Xylella fastidiosa subsp. fastidiosa]RWA39181.1 hypothetical protein XfCFBP8082_11090 [Xylella fastidiosa subsp. fastidiosa]
MAQFEREGTNSMFSDSLDKDAQEWIKALRLNYFHLARYSCVINIWCEDFPGKPCHYLIHCRVHEH